MAKKKEMVGAITEVQEVQLVSGLAIVEAPKIQPLTQEFSNGDMNTLRDKVNEIIRAK